jgi:hypothetical protein
MDCNNYQACFILSVTRTEINFRANTQSPSYKTKNVCFSRFKPTYYMSQGIDSLADSVRMKQPWGIIYSRL